MRRIGTVIAAACLILPGLTGSSFAQPPLGRHADRAFQIRLGGFFLEGGGEFWDDTERTFTLDDSDFDDVVVGFSLIRSVNNYVEVGFNVDFYAETVLSDYRRFVDEDGFAIFHDSELSMVPMTVDVRVLPGGRHRIRGPRRVLKPVFYVGAGAGLNYWEYEEVGDFLDFDEDPPEVVFERFNDEDLAFEVHALAGFELPLSRRLNLLFEGRYSWFEDDLGEDFEGLGEIELGGFWVHGGASFRF